MVCLRLRVPWGPPKLLYVMITLLFKSLCVISTGYDCQERNMGGCMLVLAYWTQAKTLELTSPRHLSAKR